MFSLSRSGWFVLLAAGVLAFSLDPGDSSAGYDLKQNSDGTAVIASPEDQGAPDPTKQGTPQATGTSKEMMNALPKQEVPPVMQQVQQASPAPAPSAPAAVKTGPEADGPCADFASKAYAHAACEDRLARIERVKEIKKGGSKSAKKSKSKEEGIAPDPALAANNAALMAQIAPPGTVPSAPPAAAPAAAPAAPPSAAPLPGG